MSIIKTSHGSVYLVCAYVCASALTCSFAHGGPHEDVQCLLCHSTPIPLRYGLCGTWSQAEDILSRLGFQMRTPPCECWDPNSEPHAWAASTLTDGAISSASSPTPALVTWFFFSGFCDDKTFLQLVTDSFKLLVEGFGSECYWFHHLSSYFLYIFWTMIFFTPYILTLITWSQPLVFHLAFSCLELFSDTQILLGSLMDIGFLREILFVYLK